MPPRQNSSSSSSFAAVTGQPSTRDRTLIRDSAGTGVAPRRVGRVTRTGGAGPDATIASAAPHANTNSTLPLTKMTLMPRLKLLLRPTNIMLFGLAFLVHSRMFPSSELSSQESRYYKSLYSSSSSSSSSVAASSSVIITNITTVSSSASATADTSDSRKTSDSSSSTSIFTVSPATAVADDSSQTIPTQPESTDKLKRMTNTSLADTDRQTTTAAAAATTTVKPVYKSPLEIAEEEATATRLKAASAQSSIGNDTPPPPVSSLLPWSNLTTVAYSRRMFYSGYRNQMQAFTMVVLHSIANGYGQILVNTLQMKDTYGSNRNIPFQKLWDVEYWNSFYPKLPRLVLEDFRFHPNYDNNTRTKFLDWVKNRTMNETTIPDSPVYLKIPQHKLMPGYKQYSKGRGPFRIHDGKAEKRRFHLGDPHPADLLMQQKALRPNPELRNILDTVIQQMHEEAATISRPTSFIEQNSSQQLSANDNNNNRYMTLHARVEPDMQQHPVCKDAKVLNLTDILGFVEEGLINGTLRPIPKFIFMPMNKKLMEHEARWHSDNIIARNNLKALDNVLRNGLLNGTVPVVHGYNEQLLRNTSYQYRPSTTQAALSYHIAIDAEIFVGTRVSSYSHALVTSRFYRDRYLPNFEYLPDGLHDWTPLELERPPPFLC